MIILLSPAKTLNFEQGKYDALDAPKFRKESKVLVDILKEKNAKGIQDLMHVSSKIADLNVDRFNNYSSRFTNKNSKAALFTFDGDVYKGLDAQSLTKAQTNYAQKHVRILSGLYGILKPLDKMQAYRLEMGTKLTTPLGKNLYDFWGDKITKNLNTDLKAFKEPMIINLASNEYFKSVKKDKLKARLITPNFKEYKGDDLKFISFNAKKARGLMTRYIIDQKIKDVDSLKGFDYEGYSFSEAHSKDDDLIFVR